MNKFVLIKQEIPIRMKSKILMKFKMLNNLLFINLKRNPHLFKMFRRENQLESLLVIFLIFKMNNLIGEILKFLKRVVQMEFTKKLAARNN